MLDHSFLRLEKHCHCEYVQQLIGQMKTNLWQTIRINDAKRNG